LKIGGGVFRVTEGDVPMDAKIRGTAIDPATGLINIFVQSETFAEVAEGAVVPIAEAMRVVRLVPDDEADVLDRAKRRIRLVEAAE
jgi:hypothetical protein